MPPVADKLTRTVTLELPPVAYGALCTLAERSGVDVAHVLEDVALLLARYYLHSDERYQRLVEGYVGLLLAVEADDASAGLRLQQVTHGFADILRSEVPAAARGMSPAADHGSEADGQRAAAPSPRGSWTCSRCGLVNSTDVCECGNHLHRAPRRGSL